MSESDTYEHPVAMLRASHEPAPGGASRVGTWNEEDLTDRTNSQADIRAAYPGRMRLCALQQAPLIRHPRDFPGRAVASVARGARG